MLLDSHDIYVMHIILHILYERVQIKLHLCVSSSYFKLTVQIRFKSYSMLGTNTSDKKFDFLFFILMYVCYFLRVFFYMYAGYPACMHTLFCIICC